MLTDLSIVVQEVEVLDKEDEGHTPEESAEESSEYEEYTGTVFII